jgi:anti-anti-sigma factor
MHATRGIERARRRDKGREWAVRRGSITEEMIHMTLDRSMRGDVCVLAPKKNLTGGEETRFLTDTIDQITAGGVTKVVIDLGKISWVNSMGLAGLQRARLICINRGASFRLARVGSRIRNLLLTTRLVILFDSFETLEEAVVRPEPPQVFQENGTAA